MLCLCPSLVSSPEPWPQASEQAWVCAIFLVSEAGFPGPVTIECADNVALRVGVAQVATAEVHELGTPLPFSKGFQAFMAPGLVQVFCPWV